MGKIGSTALIVFSIVTFIASIILPILVQAPDQSKSIAVRPPASLAPLASKLEVLRKNKPTLLTTWFVSHFIFAAAMCMAPLVTSVRVASALVAVCGIPWCLASWAPMTFMGVEVSRLGDANNTTGVINRRTSDARDIELERLNGGPGSSPNNRQEGLSGIYLGILNLFTTLPQFVGTFMSAIVFWIFEPARTEGTARAGYNSIAICLFIGACCVLVAAYRTLVLQSLQPKT